MKRKFIAFALSTVILSSCSKTEDKKTEQHKVQETKTEEKQEKVEKTEEKKTNIGFDGRTAEIDDLKIVITEYKVIRPGESGNEYGEKPVIAFWYETTNKTDKEIDPMIAWHAVFTVIQDNSKDMVNELQAVGHPDKNLLNNQMSIIKKDGTVKNAVAYELTDETTPITLKATKGVLGKEIGKHNFEIK